MDEVAQQVSSLGQRESGDGRNLNRQAQTSTQLQSLEEAHPRPFSSNLTKGLFFVPSFLLLQAPLEQWLRAKFCWGSAVVSRDPHD